MTELKNLFLIEEEKESIDQSFISNFEKYLKKYKSRSKKQIKLKDVEKNIIEFLNLNITPEQLYAFKFDMLSKGIIVIIFALLIGLFLVGFNFSQLLFIIIGGTISYLIIYYVTENILPIIKELEKMYMYREAINFIQFLVMRLRLNPNLENALEFSAKYVGGSLGRDIKKKINEMKYQGMITAIDIIDYLINKWGDEIPGFKSSLNLIKASIIEKDYARRQELLDSAIVELSDNIYVEISKRIRALKQPSMALFYLGVLLPVLLSILYPILIFTPLASLVGKAFAVALFWFILPALIILFIMYLILQRPIIYYVVEDRSKILSIEPFVVFLLIIFGSLIFSQVVKSYIISLLPFFILGVYGYFRFTTGIENNKKEIDEIKKIEQEFPDTLYLISTKLNQGRPLEEAIGYVVEELPNYEITKKIYSKIYEIFSRTGITLESILSGSYIEIKELEKSVVIKNSLSVLIEASKLGPRTSATITTSLINQISKIRKTNEMINNLFSEISGAMRFLSVFVAPFSLGIVSGLYNISINIVKNITASFSSTGTSFGLISAMLGVRFNQSYLLGVPSPEFMAMVLGIYSIIIVVLLTFYSKYIEEGPIFTSILYSLGKNLILASIVYCIGVIIGSSIVG